MVPRNQRLSKKRIEYLFKKGKKIAQNSLVVKFLPTTRPFSRFCVIVSAKTEAKAVKRNLLRRRIYEILRLNENLLKSPLDLIIITNPPIVNSPYGDHEKNILSLFKNLNLFNK